MGARREGGGGERRDEVENVTAARRECLIVLVNVLVGSVTRIPDTLKSSGKKNLSKLEPDKNRAFIFYQDINKSSDWLNSTTIPRHSDVSLSPPPSPPNVN